MNEYSVFWSASKSMSASRLNFKEVTGSGGAGCFDSAVAGCSIL